MKKVWIASILATLMLTVPISSVVSANEIVDEECLECQPVSRVDLLKVRLWLIRLGVAINSILSKFNHIPEVKEKCEEVSDRINELIFESSLEDFPKICDFLALIYMPLWFIFLILPYGIISEIFFWIILTPILMIVITLNCDWLTP